MDFTPELNLNFDVDIFRTGYGSKRDRKSYWDGGANKYMETAP